MKATDLTREVWLLLLREGGWWTLQELREHLDIDRGSKERQALYHGLTGLVTSGAVARRDGVKPQYAVLPGCVVPRGMTVGEVQL